MSTADTPPSRKFSLAKLGLIVPWVALVIDAWGPIRDNSFLWHVRAGSLQADTGSVLTEDPFSFTMLGADWRTQSWLAELLYGWAEDAAGGLGFVPPMLLVVSTLLFFGLGLIAYRYSQSVTGTLLVLILSTLLLISFLVPRPVLLSYLLFALVIVAWDQPRARWAIPFLFWIWASVHGSFLIGLAYVGLSLIMRKDWRALPIAVMAGLVTLFTAHGFGAAEFLLDFTSAGDVLPLLTEWRRPTLDSPVFLAFLGGVAFVVIGAYRQRIAPRHMWLIIPFLALGFSSLRATPPAWLGLVPLVALSAGDMTLGTRSRFGLPSAGLFAAVTLVLPFLLIEEAAVSDQRFPVEASPHLLDVPTFHDDVVGGYLIWAEWPEHLVYIDDRAELYLDRMEEFVELRSGEHGWRASFDRDGIEQALLANEEPLIADLTSAGWETVYSDDHWSILRP